MINWKDFESTTDNNTESFEDLCRIFFKFHFVKNKDVNLYVSLLIFHYKGRLNLFLKFIGESLHSFELNNAL